MESDWIVALSPLLLWGALFGAIWRWHRYVDAAADWIDRRWPA
jgi:hypothetical protein